ncbi:unnamed protein product [Penicillium olsonii]|uniref:Uncharacterized protein n=1 Tax=Penicillium olsonii TaxID=99116 RepID=A0A9W4HW02_PENOL|nr:unnamed protein product [Penicillium olsonii]CAG8138758.1 unnamed protein product [Penicillium olsonii]
MFLPDSNIPFASRFPVKCFFTPLSKSLQLDTVKLLVMERHVLRVDATAAESALHNISTIATSRTSTIFQSEHTSFDQTSGLLATEGDEPPAEWSLSLPVQLPESFDLASQSVLAGIINISHRVVVKAQFRDTENNANITIEEEIPFSIYMTPAVIASNGEIHGHYIERFKSYECAPPAYGQHKCDAIPPEWAEYLRQFNASSQRPHYEQGTVHDMSCIPAVQGSLDIEPPVYQFCAS